MSYLGKLEKSDVWNEAVGTHYLTIVRNIWLADTDLEEYMQITEEVGLALAHLMRFMEEGVFTEQVTVACLALHYLAGTYDLDELVECLEDILEGDPESLASHSWYILMSNNGDFDDL